MHHDGVALRQLQPRRRHLIARNVVLQLNLQTSQALALHPQQHDHVGSTQGFFDVPRQPESRHKRRCHVRHQLGRTAQGHLHAHPGQQVARTPRHPAVKDVANDRGLQPLQRFLVLQDRYRVEQRLRRMLVHSISGIHDGNVEMLRHEMRRAGRGMPERR